MEQENSGGQSAHAANVARWPNLYREACEIVPAEWPYECEAKRRHPDHRVYRCASHGVWWHAEEPAEVLV